MKHCSSCGSTHLAPVPCGLSFRDRLLSVRIDTAGMDTVERHKYYDRDAVAANFGADARERMMDDTHGYGAGRRDSEGRHWHQGKDGWEPMSDEEVERVYLSGPEVADPLAP